MPKRKFKLITRLISTIVGATLFCLVPWANVVSFACLSVSSASTGSNRPFGTIPISVVTPTRSQTSWLVVDDASLVTTLVPSLRKSLTAHEIENFALSIVVVFDSGDKFWEHDHIRNSVRHSSWLPVHFISVVSTGRIPFNEGCRYAYELGNEYIIRVNDDTEFAGTSWLSEAVTTLKEFNPVNVGVVGPYFEEGNTEILTHDMVHRTHLDIFQEYYPVEFDNWWIDDWISQIYGENNTRKLRGWRVFHHVNEYGQRYEVNKSQADLLPALVRVSKRQILDFISKNASTHQRVLVSELPGVSIR